MTVMMLKRQRTDPPGTFCLIILEPDPLLALKADRWHPHDYSTHRQTPWTDNDSS